MDQGLKERLVGAAVLIAIAVWLVPWVVKSKTANLDFVDTNIRVIKRMSLFSILYSALTLISKNLSTKHN
jgi:hypothetical protein